MAEIKGVSPDTITTLEARNLIETVQSIATLLTKEEAIEIYRPIYYAACRLEKEAMQDNG